MRKIPYFEIIANNNFDFGKKLGILLSANIKSRLKLNLDLYKRHGMIFDEKMKQKMSAYMKNIAKYFPNIADEIDGMGVGSGVDTHDLMLMMTEEEFFNSISKCTTLAIKTGNGDILLGHNEDWFKEYRINGLYVINAKINGNNFLALSYMGSLAGTSAGLNSFGLAYSGNSLKSRKWRIGVPRSVQMRAFLDARNLNELLKFDLLHSTIGGNTLSIWNNNVIYDVEEFWGSHFVLKNYNFLAHTNHPLINSKKNRYNSCIESETRYNMILEYLTLEKPLSKKTIMKVLSDHKAGICGHPKRQKKDIGVTIGSVIINPTEGWMEVASGNPCVNKYYRYRLME